MVVERPSHATLFTLGRTEVDDEGRDAARSERAHGRDVWGDVVDLRGHHERRDEQRDWTSRVRRRGRVTTQPVVRPLVHDFVRRPIRISQATEANDLERVAQPFTRTSQRVHVLEGSAGCTSKQMPTARRRAARA